MNATAERVAEPPYASRAGLVRGVRLAGASIPMMAVFGVAFGAMAAQKGLTLSATTLMSAAVFAGASQFVAVEIWSAPMTIEIVATLALITAAVNLRFVLMGASLRPWLGGLPAWQTYPALALMTDPGWLIATRYRAEGGGDAAVFLGGGLALWQAWIAGTLAGHVLGAMLSDAHRYGIDLVLPAFFVAILVPLWRGPRRAVAWAVAGAVALLVAALVPGWWFIVAGALAGSAAAGLLDERD
ncbi:MAG: AzlC family ABC transporter permease [Proteobacteria bacterium]|nr:AzlC family ABC transporter permease [Pseudomonadota bacterium]